MRMVEGIISFWFSHLHSIHKNQTYILFHLDDAIILQYLWNDYFMQNTLAPNIIKWYWLLFQFHMLLGGKKITEWKKKIECIDNVYERNNIWNVCNEFMCWQMLCREFSRKVKREYCNDVAMKKSTIELYILEMFLLENWIINIPIGLYSWILFFF